MTVIAKFAKGTMRRILGCFEEVAGLAREILLVLLDHKALGWSL
jgi:hypothetical protein